MLCVFYDGVLEGSSESGSGEAGYRSCDSWFTRHSAYPLHHGVCLYVLCGHLLGKG